MGILAVHGFIAVSNIFYSELFSCGLCEADCRALEVICQPASHDSHIV